MSSWFQTTSEIDPEYSWLIYQCQRFRSRVQLFQERHLIERLEQNTKTKH